MMPLVPLVMAIMREYAGLSKNIMKQLRTRRCIHIVVWCGYNTYIITKILEEPTAYIFNPEKSLEL
jgi:hypothetical protein